MNIVTFTQICSDSWNYGRRLVPPWKYYLNFDFFSQNSDFCFTVVGKTNLRNKSEFWPKKKWHNSNNIFTGVLILFRIKRIFLIQSYWLQCCSYCSQGWLKKRSLQEADVLRELFSSSFSVIYLFSVQSLEFKMDMLEAFVIMQCINMLQGLIPSKVRSLFGIPTMRQLVLIQHMYVCSTFFWRVLHFAPK